MSKARKLAPLACVHCGEEFAPTHHAARLCSARCRRRREREGKARRKREARERLPRADDGGPTIRGFLLDDICPPGTIGPMRATRLRYLIERGWTILREPVYVPPDGETVPDWSDVPGAETPRKPTRKYRLWTEDEVHALLKRRRAGESFAEIARAMDRPVASVRGRYRVALSRINGGAERNGTGDR